MIVAVGFNPRIVKNKDRRRVVTIENDVRLIQSSLRDGDPFAPFPWVKTHG